MVVEAVEEHFPGVTAHLSETNLGVASGRNAGAALAISMWAPDYLLFLDNDMELEPGFVTELSAVLDRLLHHAETVAIEGPSYRMKDQIEK